jgi:hypothetical protein
MAAQSFSATISSTGALQLPQAILFTLGSSNIGTLINIPDGCTLVGIRFDTNAGHVDFRQTTADGAAITPASDPVLPVAADTDRLVSVDDGVSGRNRIKQIVVSSPTGSTVVRAFIEGRQGG